MSPTLTIREIWRFPVKSMQGERLTEATIDWLGITGDRQWAVLDVASGTTLTARRCPELLFVSARYHPADDDVEVVLPDGHQDLGAFLGREVRLVRAGPGVKGTFEIAADFEAEDTSKWFSWEGPEQTFHDSGETVVSLLSKGSIGQWDLRRFRTNLIADGAGEMDLVGSTLKIGSVEAVTTKAISRCVMVTRPQPDGIDRDLDVLRTINRTSEGNLGLAMQITKPGTITVGDTVEVRSSAG